MKIFNHWRVSAPQIILLGFAAAIFLGALILTAPVSVAADETVSFSEALFTATSAVCVTGLVVRDTASTWSVFGQTVIMIMIQIGGVGVITVGIMIAMASRRKIGLVQRSIMQNSISAPNVGGILELTGFIIRLTLLFEFAGMLAMFPAFAEKYGTAEGLRISLFHSVSAFCNAGFDLMGGFSSLTEYHSNILINIVICSLIIAGGLGFVVWNDISNKKFAFSRYALHTKIVIMATVILIGTGIAWFCLLERQALPEDSSFLAALFQSVTLRTAGFNTVDLTKISESGKLLMIALMLVGGSSGSTAGGMKTTTAAVLAALALSVFKRQNDVVLHKRSLKKETVHAAAAIAMIYIFFFVICAMVISKAEGLPLLDCLFETASAIGTVGLTMGITPVLGTFSRLILMMLMFFGRVGVLTIIYAAVAGKKYCAKYPEEDVIVG